MSNEIEKNTNKLYEVGFHLISSVDEEKIADEFANLKETLTKNKAEIIKEAEPKLVNLAYEMTKKINDKNYNFTTGYFGWVKFYAESAATEEIKNELDANNSILRFILIKTVDDDENSTSKILNESEDSDHKKDSEIEPETDNSQENEHENEQENDQPESEELTEKKEEDSDLKSEDIDDAIEELAK